MKGVGKLDSISIRNILNDIFVNKKSKPDEIISKLKYADVTYTVMIYMHKLIQSKKYKDNEFYEKVYNILENITIDGIAKSFAYKQCEDKQTYKEGRLRNILGKLWASFLKCSLPVVLRVDIMIALGDNILTRVKDASMLADHVITAFETNHELGVASLKALCYLMRHEQIDYLPVYDGLMELLDERLFSSQHLARFFEDFDVILSTTNLPHEKAIAFIKRLAELSQSCATIEYQPMLQRLIINVLKRHPMTQSLIDSSKKVSEENRTYLLEVKSFQNHFDSDVRTLAEQINYKLNDRVDQMEPSVSIALRTKKVKKCKETIVKAIDCLMASNSSLPQLANIEYFGTLDMALLQ